MFKSQNWRLWVAAALLAAALGASTVLILREMERREVGAEAQLIRAAVDDRLRGLMGIAMDWAVWDDAYRFVQGKSPNFAQDNLNDNVLSRLDADVIVFFDGEGQLVQGHEIERTNRRLKGLSTDDVNRFREAFNGRLTTDGRRGIIRFSQGAMLVVAHPVVKSDLSGPPAGMLVMGRWMGNSLMDEISDLMQGTIAASDPAPGDEALDRERLEPVSFSEFKTSLILPDTEGRPALKLSAIRPRPLMRVEVVLVLLQVFSLAIFAAIGSLLESKMKRAKYEVGSMK